MAEIKKEEDIDSLKKASEGKSQLLRQGNVSIILDSYDDLFSDFDPRDFSVRTLSDDFLAECKKTLIGKEDIGEIELRLLMPKAKRRLSDDIKIKRRIRKHFHKSFLMKKHELNSMKKEGILWFMLGSALILLNAAIASNEGYFYKIIFVILEPAGWFTVWTGLQKAFVEASEKKGIAKFYSNMAKIRISFESY